MTATLLGGRTRARTELRYNVGALVHCIEFGGLKVEGIAPKRMVPDNARGLKPGFVVIDEVLSDSRPLDRYTGEMRVRVRPLAAHEITRELLTGESGLKLDRWTLDGKWRDDEEPWLTELKLVGLEGHGALRTGVFETRYGIFFRNDQDQLKWALEKAYQFGDWTGEQLRLPLFKPDRWNGDRSATRGYYLTPRLYVLKILAEDASRYAGAVCSGRPDDIFSDAPWDQQFLSVPLVIDDERLRREAEALFEAR